MTMENSECLELMRETKDKLLCYAAAQSWPTVKKSVSLIGASPSLVTLGYSLATTT